MQTPTNKNDSVMNTVQRGGGSRILTVLDWDDTILPTKDIIKHDGEMELPQRFISIAASVLELLLELSADDGLIILSSSTEGWVQQSCATFAPELEPLLERARIVHTPKTTRQLGFKQKCPTVVQLANKFCQAGFASNDSHLEMLLIGNMPGDVEPAKALRVLYPRVPVKTCLLKEVPNVIDLERQLSYLLHSLTPLVDDLSGVDDYSIAQACEIAEIDEYSKLCARRRTILRGATVAGKVNAKSDIPKPEHDKPLKHGYRRRSLACEA